MHVIKKLELYNNVHLLYTLSLWRFGRKGIPRVSTSWGEALPSTLLPRTISFLSFSGGAAAAVDSAIGAFGPFLGLAKYGWSMAFSVASQWCLLPVVSPRRWRRSLTARS